MKKFMLLLPVLVLTLICSITTAHAAEEWEKAEKDLKRFAEKFGSNYTCFLVDLDGDKIPELATVNTEDSHEHCIHVYTYAKYKKYGINAEPDGYIAHSYGTYYQGSYRLLMDDLGKVKIHEKNERYYLDGSPENIETETLGAVEQTLSSWSPKGMTQEAYL